MADFGVASLRPCKAVVLGCSVLLVAPCPCDKGEKTYDVAIRRITNKSNACRANASVQGAKF